MLLLDAAGYAVASSVFVNMYKLIHVKVKTVHSARATHL
jgi:hypothetical protein